MANEEHLEILKQGVGVWNEWRQVNSGIRPDFRLIDLEGVCLSFIDFSFVDLREAKLSQANFYRANFSRAVLNGANFTGANLKEANLSRVLSVGTNFLRADFRGANLSKSDFSMSDFVKAVMKSTNFNGTILHGADFSYADLSNANLNSADLNEVNFNRANLSNALLSFTDLSRTDLQGAKLQEADLQGANLSGLDLRQLNIWDVDFRDAILSNVNMSGLDISKHRLGGADLSYAKLMRTIALATNFQDAILTGACIEDWHINSDTNLNDVGCDYIYLRYPQQERRPHSGKFEPGDFVKLVQDSLDTVDLIFNNGVNWKAFTYSFHNTQVENEGASLSIRSIENKGDGVVLIRVAVPPNADKSQIHGDFMQGYKFAKKELEFQYQAKIEDKDKYNQSRLEDKDKHINQLFKLLHQAQEKSGEVQKIMAEKAGIQQNFHGNIGSVAGNVEGDQKTIQHNYAPEQKQTLAEAAAEIQKLLKQLEQTNPSATEAQQIEHINDETTPKFKKRVVGALQATGEAAIDEFVLENKYLKVAKAAIKGWIKPE
jgi:uncharacterized protein YjbI with pentapeptide repeats